MTTSAALYDPVYSIAHFNSADEHAAISSHNPSAHEITVAIATIGVTTVIRVAVPPISITAVSAVATKEAMTAVVTAVTTPEPAMTAKASAATTTKSSAVATTMLGCCRRNTRDGGRAQREYRNAGYQSFLES
jgi:hypothetical protein